VGILWRTLEPNLWKKARAFLPVGLVTLSALFLAVIMKKRTRTALERVMRRKYVLDKDLDVKCIWNWLRKRDMG